MAKSKRVRLLISGRVQGVYFRAYAQDEARGLGLRGWVRNLPDGRVEAVAQGDPAQLKAFEAWCRRGPSHARVQDVVVVEEDVEWTEPFPFEIRF